VPVTVNLNGGLAVSAGDFTYNAPALTVTFSANGGSGVMAPQSSSTPAALTLNSFTRAGYTFEEWNTEADGSGDPYLNGATFPFTADDTLYAQWSVTPPDGILGSFQAVGTGLAPGVAVNSSVVRALALSDDSLFVGGSFDDVVSGPVQLRHIATWPRGGNFDDTWGTLGAGLNSNVFALVHHDDTLYLGGQFSNATSGPTLNNIAAWAPGLNGDDTWSRLANGLNGTVTSLAKSANSLFVGGFFTAETGGVANSLSKVARWSPDGSGDDTWSSLGAGLAGGDVNAVTVVAGTVFAGGNFSQLSGGPSNTLRNVAAWNAPGFADTWSPLNAGLNGIVWSAAAGNNQALIGGTFNETLDPVRIPLRQVASWSVTAGGGWSSLGDGVDATSGSGVYALASDDTRGLIYAGGNFTKLPNQGSTDVRDLQRVGVWDAGISAWIPFKWGPSRIQNGISTPSSTVRALAVDGSVVYVGGDFDDAGGGSNLNRIAKWTWDPPVGSNSVTSLPATLTGESFIGVPATDGVTFGGVPVTYTRDDSSTITVTAAPGAPSGAILIDGVGGWGSVGTYTASNPPSPSSNPPSAPVNVSGVAGDGSVTVSWDPPADSGSFAVTNYEVVASPGGRVCLVDALALSCVVSGLTNGTAYTFEVRALNGAGWGAWSQASAPVIPVGPEPTPSIVVTGSRGTGENAGRVFADGVTTSLVGERVQARVHLSGQVKYENGSIRTVAADGTFRWQRRTNKTVYVYFRVVDEPGVRSNRLVIRPSRG
jgi:uncharacterized repeat protein (TIGR02543 family)